MRLRLPRRGRSSRCLRLQILLRTIRRGTTELTLRHLGNKQDPQLRVEFPIELLGRAGAQGNSCPGLVFEAIESRAPLLAR